MKITRELMTNMQESVTLYVEEPQWTRNNEYSCRIGIEGAGLDASTVLYGIDAIQALMLAIVHLDNFVRKVSRSINPKFIVWDAGADKNDYGLLLT